MSRNKPNVIFVFGDQWRGQATGYSGDPNAHTPTLDRLAAESINFTNAISGCPVCTPYRASLLTGRFVTSHGLFMNDVHLDNDAVSIAQAFNQNDYNTAYIGKWHVNGHGRSAFIPREHRQGFDFWKVLECTHDYNNSFYYADNDEKLKWDGYDAFAQTREAINYIENYDEPNPFFMVLSWGPPHEPYDTAPAEYRKSFAPDDIKLRPNVSKECQGQARVDLAGYYSHIAALDDCMDMLLLCLEEQNIVNDTLLVFTSDHGDMLGSHGQQKKQRPWEESIRVPFLLRYPALFGNNGCVENQTIDSHDIMPTLLGLCDLEVPSTVEGYDYSNYLQGGQSPEDNFALLSCVTPFGQYNRIEHNAKEYRGIRTPRYTYVCDRNGPWLLYDSQNDPFQRENLCNNSNVRSVQNELDMMLKRELLRRNDSFQCGEDYIEKWGYIVDETGTVPYED